jgi:hypothetical protein
LLAIVYFFLDLALLKRAPQDLPASSVLFALALLARLLGGMLLEATAGGSPWIGLTRTLLDFGLMLAALYGALSLMGLRARFLQAATALLGTETLIALMALLPMGLANPETAETGWLVLAGLLFLGLVFWSVLIAGHILRHAFGIDLMQGVIIAVGFGLLSVVVVGALTDLILSAPTDGSI